MVAENFTNRIKMKNDFQVMSEMSKKNMDIKMSPDVSHINVGKNSGWITMTVDRETALGLFKNPDKYYLGLYIVDKKQFEELKEGVK